MSELVVVLSDLYLSHTAPTLDALPGLDAAARFGTVSALGRDWRSSLALRLDRADLAQLAPAVIAAAARVPDAPAVASPAPFVCFATPLSVSAGLTSLHLRPGGILHLDALAQRALAESFATAFAGSGYALAPLTGGGFLATGPAVSGELRTRDPARCLGASLMSELPQGAGAAQLRRLATEIEMWLHTHPLNAARVRAQQAPVSMLWLWGEGGPAPAAQPNAADIPRAKLAAFGDDPYLEGLCRRVGARCLPLPGEVSALFDAPAARMLVTIEVYGVPDQSHPLDPARRLAEVDARWILPAVEALRRGEVRVLSILLSDHGIELRGRDFLKRWRRSRRALEVLR